ncbi:MAG: TetR/AcrR family transcriptional regulator, partial [Solirubrobacteraceae bacterium]
MTTTATPPNPHRRPRPAHASSRPRGAARREALLEAVLRIVAEVGPDAVTHRRVAEVAGLPLASTTYWFESKEQLLTAALELAAERDTARLLSYAASVAGDGSREGADLIEAIVGAIVSDDDHAPTTRTSVIATLSLLLEAA